MNGDMTAYISSVRELMYTREGSVPLAYVRTYGCQQNVADGEKLKGLLAQMGFEFTDSDQDAGLHYFQHLCCPGARRRPCFWQRWRTEEP